MNGLRSAIRYIVVGLKFDLNDPENEGPPTRKNESSTHMRCIQVLPFVTFGKSWCVRSRALRANRCPITWKRNRFLAPGRCVLRETVPPGNGRRIQFFFCRQETQQRLGGTFLHLQH